MLGVFKLPSLVLFTSSWSFSTWFSSEQFTWEKAIAVISVCNAGRVTSAKDFWRKHSTVWQGNQGQDHPTTRVCNEIPLLHRSDDSVTTISDSPLKVKSSLLEHTISISKFLYFAFWRTISWRRLSIVLCCLLWYRNRFAVEPSREMDQIEYSIVVLNSQNNSIVLVECNATKRSVLSD